MSGDVTPTAAVGFAEPAALDPPLPPLDHTELEAWAAALASALENPSQPRVLPAPHASPETWQRGGKALTQRSAPTPQRADGAGNVGNGAKAPVPTEERVQVTVRLPELGELAVVLTRAPHGLRVVIGVEGARALAVVDPERARLRGALMSVGVRVDSIEVVRVDGRGTLLASTKTERAARTESDERANADPRRKPKGRKVSFVG
ncbi:MAG TPA: hypothetical protein VKY73_21600 [Polyangiaceae bacterium]|nr:hypothetical protein [Polyangiaceae bacterium]